MLTIPFAPRGSWNTYSGELEAVQRLTCLSPKFSSVCMRDTVRIHHHYWPGEVDKEVDSEELLLRGLTVLFLKSAIFACM